MRVLESTWWTEEDHIDGYTEAAYAGADHPQAQGSGAAAGRGRSITEVTKALEISEQTFHRWRAQYGGMKADDAKRLKELERENARLKRIVADQVLENQALREIAKGNW